MLSIYAPTKFHDTIQEIIQREERLHELVKVIDYLEERPVPSADNLLVKREEIWPLLDWYNLQPPFLLPENVPFNEPNLLGLVFARLHNYEKAHEYLSPNNPSLLRELDFINRLSQGIPIRVGELQSQYSPFEEYRLMHNQAVVIHYTTDRAAFDLNKAKYFYLEALQAAPSDEYRAFTGRQFALLLIDAGEVQDAERVLNAMLNGTLSDEAEIEIKHTLCQAWMQRLTVPYDEALLAQLKATLWEVLQAYEKNGRKREQALALTDAGIVANYSESWAESLGYFQRALELFEAEGLPELAAQVHYRKGTLLFTWAQSGNPQFYRKAAESYQKAVNVFTKESVPAVYAEIQHHLGLIYAEIPDDVKKKSIWAAVSSNAFQEALGIYTREAYPYDYATVCSHYGNALVKYPEAKLSDNIEKALFYYQESLRIRTADKYPLERCLTLLNYLEANWHLGMPEDKFDEERYEDMLGRAKEILAISPDIRLKESANDHLEKLTQLKQTYA